MKTEILISEEVKSEASTCTRGQKCLTGDFDGLCTVVFCVNSKILGVHSPGECYCQFKHTMEDRTCCTCPVRNEIYKKYNV